MTAEARDGLLQLLKTRFGKHRERHPGIEWAQVEARLAERPEALVALEAMEASGGEPDVIGLEPKTGRIVFCDCAAESPAGRRSVAYDAKGRLSRKENQPESSALERAAEMGVDLLTEDEYRALQELGEFDRKTSSWVMAPPGLRALGGALFCDRRYGRVFVYHNGPQSYYAGRGFRTSLRV